MTRRVTLADGNLAYANLFTIPAVLAKYNNTLTKALTNSGERQAEVFSPLKNNLTTIKLLSRGTDTVTQILFDGSKFFCKCESRGITEESWIPE